MPLGNNKGVGRRLRVDVVEGEDFVVFVDEFGGDLLLRDLTEDAVAHDLAPFFLSPEVPYRFANSWKISSGLMS